MTVKIKIKKEPAYGPFHPSPRSQAIYGSSVETFGPYPQDYTTLKLYLAILCYYPTINFLKKSTKNEHSYKRMFVCSVFLHIIPIQLLQGAYL